MTDTTLQKSRAKFFKHQWPGLLIALIFFAVYLFAKSSPRESLFLAQEGAKKLLKLGLGVIYLIVDGLPTIFAALIVLVATFIIYWIVLSLIQQKRWPTLIPMLLLIASNLIFIGAPSFVLSRSVSPRDIRCEIFFTESNGLRVVRYPLDIQRDYAEQQFFMMSFDGGDTWGQFAQTFVYEPLIELCQGVEFSDEQNGTLIVENSIDYDTTEYLTYQTTDGGQNWEIVAREQP